MARFPDVELGWKIYILVWTWLGIAAWIGGNNFTAAWLIWAFGASAAWIFEPMVSQNGWRVVVRYLAIPLVILASLLLLMRAYNEKAPKPPPRFKVTIER